MSKALKTEISAIHYELDEKTEVYARKKVAKLVDYIPRNARPSAFANVKISQISKKDVQDKFECEIVLTLPDKVLVASSEAPYVLASIDAVEVKMKSQIAHYKTERRVDGVRTGGFVAKLKRSLRRK
ncbi:MAG: HPF/RaiA family ribosome-associated protein [Candidatus Nomurabacteria bacterium]|jgi:ribosomal subunit interface protein|nr:HPF/RaiA family ribosome-associated protein [Candidatus Nomurabacteria bacterium]